MQSKKGFTLIELLAVLIIIGVIALIVSPIVIKSIKKSGKSTFERSIDGLIESVRIDHSNDNFYAPREYFYEKKDLTLLTVAEKTKDQKIKIHGKIEGNGFIYVDEQGKIHIDNICNKEYCANGPENDIEITPNPGGEIPNHSKTDPMIKLNGDSIIYVGINEPYTELGATARTKLGEKLEYTTEIRSNNETVEYIDTSRENRYEVIYRAENDGKVAEVTRTVAVLDMKPVITMTEPNSNYVKEQEILITVSGIKPNKVSEFSYQINDGEIIKITGSSKIVTLNETGVYEIKVTATDNNGHTNTVSKTYRIDRTGPEIVLNPETVELESNEALGYDLLTGVSVTDNIDGTIENSRITIEGELLSVPGTYRVNYTVSDRLGNTSTATRTFVVKDLTKPEIVITPNETSKFVKTVNIKVTATDNIKVERISYVVIKDGVRGEVTSINNGGSVTLNSTGNYEIEITAIDNSDNSTIKTSGIYKIDTTKPELVFENVTLKVDEVAGYNLMTGVRATDNSGVTPTITYTGGLSATIGTQTITYQATDEAGNIGTKARTFTVIAADSPIISFTPIKTNGWVKSVNITISATLKIGENLTALSYKISNGTTGNGTISNNTGTASITLNTTGTYTIEATGTGSYNNTKKESSGTYQVDATVPVVGAIGGNPTAWAKNATLTSTITDAHSGVTHYMWTTSSTKPAANATGWTSVGTTTASYAFSKTITANGTYYLWAKDAAGNVSASKSVVVSKIDVTTPTITSSYTSTAYSMTEKTSVAVSTLYKATFGGMGGTVVCKNGTTTVTNLNTLAVGTHTLTCTATGKNGKAASVKPKVTVKAAGISGSDLADKDNLPNVAGGYRYQGANPNNFVTFNGQAYRIIGVFGGQMKLIYWGDYTAAGSQYLTNVAWDTSGRNNWSSPTTLNTTLNSTYWNSLNSTAQGMIDQSLVWSIGGISSGFTRSQFQAAENNGKWTGKVGLMTPADYGYASTSSSCTDSLNMNSSTACKDNNWLFTSSYHQWTITGHTGAPGNVYFVHKNGFISSNYTSNIDSTFGVRPVLYLKSNTKITGGSGTASSPYTLSYTPTEGDKLAIDNNLPLLADMYRYRGESPNNWVCFGSSSITSPGSCDANHKWRIIGIDSNGRMKIMTNYYYSTNKAWDTSRNNNWDRPATLNTELNGSTFYGNNSYIDATHRDYIINATWYTGGTYTSRLQSFVDTERTNTATGYIGLMSMVDFGYAGSGCTLSTDMNASNVCANNNWIGGSTLQHSITPNTSNAQQIWQVYNTGFVASNGVHDGRGVRPVVVLDYDVKIKSGTGTESNPYILTK